MWKNFPNNYTLTTEIDKYMSLGGNMRKRIALIVLLLACSLYGSNAFAEAIARTVTLDLNSGRFVTNGYSQESTKKPYIIKGTTMVPIDLFIDAFGVNKEINKNEKWVRLIKNNKNIKLYEGKQIAIANGLKYKLNCPIQKSGDVTMVPLRQVCSALGIQGIIGKNAKEFIYRLSDIDYNDRFEFIKKGYVGDSYYGWSISFPEGSKIVEKDSSGTGTFIINNRKSYSMYIYTVPCEDINQQNLLNELLSYVKDEAIVYQKDADQQGFAELLVEGKDGFIFYKVAVKNGRLYEMHLYMNDKGSIVGYKLNKYYTELANSFQISFNPIGTVDLNETVSGMYIYCNMQSRWKIDLPNSMNIGIEKKANEFEIYHEACRENVPVLGMNCEEISATDNSDDFFKQMCDDIQENNQDITIEFHDVIIDNCSAKMASFKKENEGNIYSYSYTFLYGNKYKYSLCLCTSVSSQIVNADYLANRILTSFKQGEDPREGGISFKKIYNKLPKQYTVLDRRRYRL